MNWDTPRLQRERPGTDIRTMLRNVFRHTVGDDAGIGIAAALSVTFVIFVLGATWYSVSVHEVEEVGHDRNRATALNVAEAGAREAMYRLASNDNGFRDAADGGQATSGITVTTCDLQSLQTVIDGTSKTVGEYWVRATPLAGDMRYLIESWGWAPNHTGRQVAHKKVVLEIELVPVGAGFHYALFAADGGLRAGNRKEIYGDSYSGDDLALSNYTRIFANDDGYPGTGQALVYRDLLIGSGANVEIAGQVKVNGFVDDAKGSSFGTNGNDLVVLNDTTKSALTKSTFKKNQSSVGRNLQVAGPEASVTDPPSASGYVWNATGIPPAPQIALPSFVWDPNLYTAAGMTVYNWPNWSQFDSWHNANADDVHGAHFVNDSGTYTLDLGGDELSGDFVLAFKGDLTLRGSPSGVTDPSLAPATVALAGVEPTSNVTLASSSSSVEGQIHHLIYSAGTFEASQQTTIYGALYGDEDVSTQRLEIHFRPPNSPTISGFTFDPALADSFLPRPGTWREVPSDALGCSLP